jgi:hypothetical protein
MAAVNVSAASTGDMGTLITLDIPGRRAKKENVVKKRQGNITHTHTSFIHNISEIVSRAVGRS